jgi:RHS repeat-associated protein
MTRPSTVAYSYPSGATTTAGPGYNYSYDGMYRLAGMATSTGTTVVNGVSYSPANQMLGMTFNGISESRAYNSLNQLISISAGSLVNLTYYYPTGANNGKISSTYEALSGETISYTYDSLNRMITAAGNGWGETYGYDSFGNLTAKTPTAGSPPSLSQAPNPANNRLVGYNYDANGNQLEAPGFYGSPTYDAENRIVAAPGVQYAYDSQNKRVWAATVNSSNGLTGQTVNFYGVNGQKIGSYTLYVNYGAGQYLEFSDAPANLEIYFGSKRVGTTQNGATTSYWQDRLGSNRTSGALYYPWGEDRGTPAPNDQVKFATYTRDSATLLDYADQRYYGNAQGRFMTPDPSRASGGPKDPGSWNRYSYTRGDPINRADPRGMDDCDPDACGWSWGDSFDMNGPSYGYACAFGFISGCSLGQIGGTGGGIPAAAAHLTPLIAPGTNQNQQQALDAGIDSAWAHIISNPSCASFLTGNSGGPIVEAWGQLANTLDNTTYSFAPLASGIAATTNAIGGNQVTINTSGAFFASPGGNGTVWTSGFNSQGQQIILTFSSLATLDASILLHELGHETGVLPADGDSAATNGSNNASILNNCFTKNAQGVYQ